MFSLLRYFLLIKMMNKLKETCILIKVDLGNIKQDYYICILCLKTLIFFFCFMLVCVHDFNSLYRFVSVCFEAVEHILST